MGAPQTYQYDVLIVGAGGAGLRAAIEAASTGVTVGLICKSLLGKAHTVMAEGGMAAAMGHNDDRDNWQVHFADTMRGGQYVNNGAWLNCMPRKRRTACANWKPGARCSTARRTAASINGISAAPLSAPRARG
jgi:succinate dehydrogenase/fumarate reductase flavoprotein subunit